MSLKVLHLFTKDVWVGVFAAVIAGVLIGVPYLRRRRAMKAFEASHKLSRGEILDSTRGGEWQGKRYRLKYHEETKHVPARLTVSLNVPSFLQVAAFRLNWWLRFCLRFGIGPDLKSGHRTLDELWYFSTDTDHHLKAVIAPPRDAEWVKLSELGADVVAAGPEGVSVRLSPFELKQAEDLQVVFSILPHLEKIATGRSTYIKKTTWTSPVESLFRFRLGIIIFLFAFVGLMVTSALMKTGDPISQWELSMFAAKVFGVIAFLFLIGVALFRRAPKMALILPLLFIALGLCIPGSIIAVGFLNDVLDQSPEITREVRVVGKKTSGKKARPKAIVESWRAGKETEEVFVGPVHFFKMVPGKSRLKIHTRAGALGFERVMDVELEGF